MKQKLKVAFMLIVLALTGIIGFQAYWTINAYKVNKERFDANVNTAMQTAMDDCKKDYFDSIRRVLVRRLSPSETTIKIDTVHEQDTINVLLHINLSNKCTGVQYTITTPELDFYRKKIDHKATIAETLTETSFYVPRLMNDFTVLLGMYDITGHAAALADFNKKHEGAPIDTMIKFNCSLPNSIYELPPDYRAADSLRLRKYFAAELKKIDSYSPFNLVIATKSVAPPALKSSMHYSETAEYSYKYQGFTLFHIVGPQLFIHAEFMSPQYAVLKNMILLLTLSILLVFFTGYCFNYILRTINDQRKLAELKDDFINNMTHELKTPIATITVAIEGLQKYNALDDPAKTQRYLQTSKNELSRLNDLVTKVLDIAMLDNRQITLVKEHIPINDMISEVAQSEKQKTPKSAELTFENKSGAEAIYADKVHLRNVIANLLDNAIKYAYDPVRVAITCIVDAGNLVISVKDNGIGIPAAHQALIFDKFHRVPTGDVHAVKGTGLGLSYVKYIVEAHGGAVTVKSEINKGSEFIVSIPLNNG